MDKARRRLINNILISMVLIFCFAGVINAESRNSFVKIGGATYPPGKKSGSTPPVSCEVQNFGDQNINLSFLSGKRRGKTAFVNLNLSLSSDEFNNLKTGDVIEFEHGSNFTNTSKVLLTFSEGTSKKSKTKIVSVSKGAPLSSDSGFSVKGKVEIVNKREDGCLDVSFNATVQNPSVTKTISTIDPEKDCIKSSDSQKLKSIPSVVISGILFPEKFTGSATSAGTTKLCDAPTIPSFPGIGSSTSSGGITIPGLPEGFPGLPEGFPGLPEGFDIPTDIPTE